MFHFTWILLLLDMSLHRWGHTLHCVEASNSLGDIDVIAVGGNGRNVHKTYDPNTPFDFLPVPVEENETKEGSDQSKEQDKLSQNEGAGQDGVWLKKKDFLRMKKLRREAEIVATKQKKESSNVENSCPITPKSQSTNTHSINGRLATFAVTSSASFISQPENPFNSSFMEWKTCKYSSHAAVQPEAREYHTSHIIPASSGLSFPLSAFPNSVHETLRESGSVTTLENGIDMVERSQYLVLLFGRTNPLNPLGDVWICHIDTQTWMKAEVEGITCPAPRYRHVSVLYGNYVIVHSGRTTKEAQMGIQTAATQTDSTVGPECLLNDTWCLDMSVYPMKWVQIIPEQSSGVSTSNVAILSPPPRFTASACLGFITRSRLTSLPTFSSYVSSLLLDVPDTSDSSASSGGVNTSNTQSQKALESVTADIDSEELIPVMFLHGGLLSTFMCDITSDRLIYALDLSVLSTLSSTTTFSSSSVVSPFRVLYAPPVAMEDKYALPLAYSHTSFAVPSSNGSAETAFIAFIGGSGPEERLFNSLASFCLSRGKWVQTRLQSSLSVAHFRDIAVSPSAYQETPFYPRREIFRSGLATALWVRHACCVLNSPGKKTKVLVAGGGSLCFSFGTYHSPSYFLELEIIQEIVGEENPREHLQYTLLAHTAPGSDSIVDLAKLYPQSAPTFVSVNADAINDGGVITAFEGPTFGIAAAQPSLSRQGAKRKNKNGPEEDIEKNKKEVVLDQATVYSCSVCRELFRSRNALFKHIQKWGHRVVDASSTEVSHS